ncbi:ABC transporter permease [Haloglomus irregulare]|jgi:putative ABC transport system permease protein|uniref:ABC transporter permease n=1 Tax=Haloglomus irregulare TaxID=2234134 RepID=A0A554NF45_9EURY|nr:ABC transporter permease [Haloglomus irregulare]TSD16027.1 ABC transporter permease [Haloglomus irregulare]
MSGEDEGAGARSGADGAEGRLGVLARFPSVLMARRNLSRNRLRSGLAALGIVIGVLAIATLGIFGNVLQLSATNELGGIGNQVIVSPNEDAGRETLSPRDVATVERVAEGRGTAVPLVTDGAIVRAPNGETFAQLYGLDRPRALFTAREGRVPEFHRQGALVGESVADRLGVQPGSAVEIEGQRFRVIAVLAETDDISPIQPSNAVVLPRDAFAQSAPSQVVVQAGSGEDASYVAGTVRERLNAREQRVSVFELSSILDRINEFFGLLNAFLIALGAVSLIVAGVAIFNVMLMSTTERRGEIGVLRAVGVQKGDVLRTLVVEAALLGVLGGLGGVLLTLLAVVALLQFTPIGADVVFDPSNGAYLVVAFSFGVVISLASGLYPAYKAANEEPVDALRD